MKAMKNLLVPTLLVALFATACGDSSDTGDTTTTAAGQPTTTTQPAAPVQQGELARADVDRATETDATSDELAALVGGDAQFAFELFRLLAADGKNTLLSPYSIAAALTMTYAGARGDTASQIEQALHFAATGDRIHTLRNELDLQVSTVEEPQLPDDDREPFTIRVANSLWGQTGYPFLEEFLVLLAENYDAGMNLVDFATAAEEARVTINSWVEEQTEGRIVDLIPQGIIRSK